MDQNQNNVDPSIARRNELDLKLLDILGNENLYYNPPESIKIKYPCIIYSLSGIPVRYAENKIYKKEIRRYELVYITRDPDTDFVNKILNEFSLISFSRPYVSDNLYHFSFDLYY